jgi:hypothetical protein
MCTSKRLVILKSLAKLGEILAYLTDQQNGWLPASLRVLVHYGPFPAVAATPTVTVFISVADGDGSDANVGKMENPLRRVAGGW